VIAVALKRLNPAYFRYYPAVTFWGWQIPLHTYYRGVCTRGAIGAAANCCGHTPRGS